MFCVNLYSEPGFHLRRKRHFTLVFKSCFILGQNLLSARDFGVNRHSESRNFLGASVNLYRKVDIYCPIWLTFYVKNIDAEEQL
jgi:hypothetical protein